MVWSIYSKRCIINLRVKLRLVLKILHETWRGNFLCIPRCRAPFELLLMLSYPFFAIFLCRVNVLRSTISVSYDQNSVSLINSHRDILGLRAMDTIGFPRLPDKFQMFTCIYNAVWNLKWPWQRTWRGKINLACGIHTKFDFFADRRHLLSVTEIYIR